MSALALLLAAALAFRGLSAGAGGLPPADAGGPHEKAVQNLLGGRFRWTVGPPLVAPAVRPEDPCYSVKDLSVVRYDGRWHLFCSIRSQKRTHQIEYLSFADWKDANAAQRNVLTLSKGYFCAPHVFYFRPQGKWYLICQVADQSRKPALQPAFSTTENIAVPSSWSAPELLFAEQPAGVTQWIDFWVICDATRAHLFFTSLDGRMWRAETSLRDFPHGWSQPVVALQADVFEASHTYKLKGLDKFLTLIEAQAGQRRYYKAYVADRLDGQWKPLAATQDAPFAGSANVTEGAGHWTDWVSHGELIRDGFEEAMEVDPAHLKFLFQGVRDEEMQGKPYGQFPWRLGMLEAGR